jgi:restriction endonuclease S subunit
LRHKIIVEQTEHKATGSSRPRLTEKDIESIWVPCPPLDIQQSIAQKTKDLHSEVVRLREEARLLLATARQGFEEHFRH